MHDSMVIKLYNMVFFERASHDHTVIPFQIPHNQLVPEARSMLCAGLDPVGVKRASHLPTAFGGKSYGNVRSGIDHADADDF